jgi:hypothetical protein
VPARSGSVRSAFHVLWRILDLVRWPALVGRGFDHGGTQRARGEAIVAE